MFLRVVNILLCIAQPTLAYVHTLGNIGQPRAWLSEVLDRTSVQRSASVLHYHYQVSSIILVKQLHCTQFPQTHFLFCIFFARTQGKLHVPTMGTLACTRPISILSIQWLTYINVKLLDIW